MSAKHTPGPWAYSRSDQFWHARFYVAQADGAAYTPNYSDVATLVAETVSLERVGVQEANARLIAAAPELLEAAKLVLAWYEAEENHAGTDFYQRIEMCRQSENAIRAAIAKATGGEE